MWLELSSGLCSSKSPCPGALPLATGCQINARVPGFPSHACRYTQLILLLASLPLLPSSPELRPGLCVRWSPALCTPATQCLLFCSKGVGQGTFYILRCLLLQRVLQGAGATGSHRDRVLQRRSNLVTERTPKNQAVVSEQLESRGPATKGVPASPSNGA